ncbi:hypothetical protein J6Y73_02230 [bacterium]|nr:hypothetical protein [bacterium]
MKIYKPLKFAFYLLLGVLVLIFNEPLLEYVPYLVGSVMLLYGIEDSILKLALKEFKEEIGKSLDNLLIIMLGIILFFLNKPEQFAVVCIIWSTWSILREEWEIKEKAIENSKSLIISIVNVIESIVVIIFSVMLIFNPTEHHAHAHIILLGIELILEVLFPLLDDIFGKVFKKSELLEKVQNKEKELNSE